MVAQGDCFESYVRWCKRGKHWFKANSKFAKVCEKHSKQVGRPKMIVSKDMKGGKE